MRNKLMIKVIFNYTSNAEQHEAVLHFETGETKVEGAICAFFECVPYKKCVAQYIKDTKNQKATNITIKSLEFGLFDVRRGGK